MPQKFYLTTPLYYVNDVPHIGHACTTIAADVLARYQRLKGFDVHFLTGTDEHGQKVWKAAEAAGKKPQQFVDEIVGRFKDAWAQLGITNDDFIRTTETRHEQAVQLIFSRLLQQGDIYKGEYEGWYCVPCETFWAEGELKEDMEGRKLCPDCGRPTDLLKEETYYFKLSKYQEQIKEYLNRSDSVQPDSRRNEIRQFVNQGLKDLSITRTAFPWGVVVKEDPKHVVYVWFDALINYVSAIGYGADEAQFQKWWPADVHLMGKEIVRFHAVTWPAMLLALGLPLPKTVFGHGWWTVEGKKMSKSKGNVVDPLALVKQYGVDAVRYFILREVPFGVDGDFSPKAFIERYNADLANDLGNLLNRTLNMIEKYFNGVIPARPAGKKKDELEAAADYAVAGSVQADMGLLRLSSALENIWGQLISAANKYIETKSPWKLAKNNENEELAYVMWTLCFALKHVAFLILPFMPDTATKIWQQLGLKGEIDRFTINTEIAGVKTAKGDPLFPKVEKTDS